MRGADDFGPDFQRVLARTCMFDRELRGLVDRFIKANQLGWTDPAALWAWQVVTKHEHVSPVVLETEARRLASDDPAKIGAEAITTISPDVRESTYVREQVVEWARRQVFKMAWEEARAAWNDNDVNAAQRVMLNRIEEMNQMSLSVADRGWFFEELDERQYRRQYLEADHGKFPIGIDKIDAAMDGGLHRGELEIPVAYSGIGKTFYCVQRGFIGAKMRRRVLHIILEGGRKKTEDRYEARFAATIYREVKRGEIDAERLTMMQRDYARMKQCLVLRGVADHDAWSYDFQFVIDELLTLRRTRGWVPGLIVVDYGDLLGTGEKGDNETEKQKSAFRKLKMLSEREDFPGHFGYAVSAPSQAVRPAPGADEREHILRPRDVADSYEKVRVADAIVTLNRTNAERDLKQARVHLGKYRDAEDGVTARVTTAYEQGTFSVLGVPEPAPPPPAIKAPGNP